MVKKLLKYDFLSYIRKLLPVELILLGVSILTRIIMFFENDSIAYELVFSSAILAYIVSMTVCMISAFSSVITRFYRNMFTNEGYLSFTLPVSVSQHLISKLISSVCVILITVVNVFVSFLIVTSGELTVEIFKAADYLLNMAKDYTGANYVFYIIEFVLMAFVGTISSILLFYACICVGHLSKKNKIRSAFLAYFALYFVTEIVETVLMVIFTETGLYDKCMVAFMNDMLAGVHLLVWISLFATVILCSVYYFVCSYIMKKKLNLE